MQPDPTPDLDELLSPCGHERPRSASQLHGVCIFCWRDRGAKIRRERDELRAELDRAVARATSRKLKNQSHAEWRKLCARVGTARATIKKRERRIIALAALRDDLRARAEKAEADLAESKRLVEKADARAKELEGMLKEGAKTLSFYGAHNQADQFRAALAQKDPR